VERVHLLLEAFASQQCYVATEADEDITTLLAVANYRKKTNRDFAWLEGLAVTPHRRGMGIVGRFVIDQLVIVTQQNNLSEIRLQSVPSAVPFYEKNQFSIMDGEENEFHPRMSRRVT
ncbi:MAG TPA: GNAT family N-acetyltransferase, partial [Candidatus Saccharimonadales bacterium]|nr:GNAT family N-acetyltransferase [Candidatus Saccharimonadales bacterium]